jgi:anti-sigma factor RsiW
MLRLAMIYVVTEYLEGALPAPDRALVESHLDTCDGCRAYLDELRTTIELSGRLEPEHLRDEAREGLRVAFRGWKPG